MILFAVAGSTIGKWLRRAMMALWRSAARSQPDVPPEYYRFPPF